MSEKTIYERFKHIMCTCISETLLEILYYIIAKVYFDIMSTREYRGSVSTLLL